MKNSITRIGIVGLALVALVISFTMWQLASASAPPGAPAGYATSSTAIVGTTTNVALFQTSSCVSRVISTRRQAIHLAFDVTASTTPSETSGIYQAASTTVVYDSGLFGCGLWTARGLIVPNDVTTASTTITIMDVR